MIEGLKLDFTSDELKSHLLAKATTHASKAASYREQADSIQEAQGDEFRGQTMNPLDELRKKALQHEQQDQLFRVLAEHLVPTETYRLTHAELVLVELISRGY